MRHTARESCRHARPKRQGCSTRPSVWAGAPRAPSDSAYTLQVQKPHIDSTPAHERRERVAQSSVEGDGEHAVERVVRTATEHDTRTRGKQTTRPSRARVSSVSRRRVRHAARESCCRARPPRRSSSSTRHAPRAQQRAKPSVRAGGPRAASESTYILQVQKPHIHSTPVHERRERVAQSSVVGDDEHAVERVVRTDRA